MAEAQKMADTIEADTHKLEIVEREVAEFLKVWPCLIFIIQVEVGFSKHSCKSNIPLKYSFPYLPLPYSINLFSGY